MNYLVTGATGFIGRNLVEHLLNRDDTITLAVRNSESFEKCGWDNRLQPIPFDMNAVEYDDLWSYFGKPDCVFHLCWQDLPNYDAAFHLTRNLPNQIRFISNLIASGCPKIITTGTCFEYGNKNGPLNEEMCCEPNNSYAIAKDSLRKTMFELSKNTGTTIIWARLFYLYGKYQRDNSLFGQLNNAIREKQESFKMTEGEQLRDYSDIEDIVHLLYLLSIKVNSSQIINVASGTPVSVRKMVETICKKQNATIDLELGAYPYSKFESMAFWADITRMHTILK
jgi:nucleoside-diphosphate-sugar epimerase